MPQLTVEGVGVYRVPAGKRLVNALVDECKIDQLHVCGGHAQCTTCQVFFAAGEPPLMRPAERRALASMMLLGHRGMRLSCQVTCDRDMTVRVFSRLEGSGRETAGPRPSDSFEMDPAPIDALQTPSLPPEEHRPPEVHIGFAGNARTICDKAGGPTGPGGIDEVPATPPRSPARTRIPHCAIEAFMPTHVTGETSDRGSQRDRPATPDQPFYRPTIRPPVPVLTILDDGSLEIGEDIRIRSPSVSIGRSGGDVVLQLDATISGQHAEIRRIDGESGPQWVLTDLKSINGTFVRVSSADIVESTIFIMGSRRYRLEGLPPPSDEEGDDTSSNTNEALSGPAIGSHPVLVDLNKRSNGIRHVLRTSSVTIGNASGACDIVIDDPLLAPYHATICRNNEGEWQVFASQSCNGVWVNIDSIMLAPLCYFQCGEQQFRFAIP